MREQTLDRLIRIGLKAVAVGVVAVAVIYFLDSRDKTPTLVNRQIAAAEAAVRKAPTQIGLRLRLADMYRAAKRNSDALEQYDAVLGVEKRQTTALLGRAEIFAEEGELPKAKAAFEEIIKQNKGEEFSGVNPQLEATYYDLGSLLLRQGQAKEAAKAAEKAVRIEGGDADAWFLAGKANVRAGAYGRAVAALRKAVLFVPTGWCEPYEELARAYGGQKRKPYVEYANAMVELCMKNTKGAVRRLESLTSGPAAVDSMLGLGMADEFLSRRTEATHWYKKVLATDPENFNARSGLGRIGDSGGE